MYLTGGLHLDPLRELTVLLKLLDGFRGEKGNGGKKGRE